MKSRICHVCQKEWVPDNSGAAKRKPKCCNDCYPLYRKAVGLFHYAEHRANLKNIEFSLTVEDVHERLKNRCPRTGVDFVIGAAGRNYKDRHPFTPSIDRINQAQGYTPDNIQVVCWWYNLSKALFSDEEVFELCQRVVNFSDTKDVLNADHLTH